MERFLYILALILILVWVLGFFLYSLGAVIHILLLLAVIVLLIRITRISRDRRDRRFSKDMRD